MAQIISVHSFRGGTGKSNFTANLAATLAQPGRRVGIIDTDIQSPGIHVLFGLNEDTFEFALNDFLWGRCPIEKAALDVTSTLTRAGPVSAGGALYLIPSSIKTGEIARVLKEGYDVGLLNDGIRSVIARLNLDYLLIDTHPGVNEETLLSIAISDHLVILLRPDQQDYQGTAVTVELARELDVPHLMLVVNKTLATMDVAAIRQKVEKAFNAQVAGIMPLNEEMVHLGSRELMALRYPDHAYTQEVRRIAALIADSVLPSPLATAPSP